MADDNTTPGGPATPAASAPTPEGKAGFFANLRNMKENIKGNFSGDALKSKGTIALRGAGSLVSLGVMYDGAKRMLRGVGVASPKLDADGKEIPAGAGAVLGGLVEFTAAAAGLYYSVIHPGKGQGMSKA